MTDQPQITTAKISDLLPYANNAREHTDEQVAQVAASIKEFGWTNPLIVHGTTVVAGHARLAAARKLNMTEVPIIDRSDMSEAQWKAYVLADNQLAQNATWNDGLLALELDNLAELDFDLDILGFPDLDALMGDEPEEGLTDPDDVPEPPEEAITQPGDLWILGDHRLLCGDSTDAESVAYLMDGAKADMVFTDPPYGIELDTSSVKVLGKTAKAKKYDKIVGDGVAFNAAHIFETFSDVDEIFIWGADYFVDTLPNFGKDGNFIVWDKRVTGHEDKHNFASEYELCWSMKKRARRIYKHDWVRFFGMQKEDSKTRLHPNQKPTQLMIDMMPEGNLVVDLYLGSGTTLIAAQKTNRKCYGLEIDPIYCDVIVKRWEAFTGKKAELHGG